MNVEIEKDRIPRVYAVCRGNDEDIASFLGVQVQYINTLVKMLGLSLEGVDEERFKSAVILQAETVAETMLSSVRAARTSFGQDEETVEAVMEETDA